ncbi:7-cyano-7-deazaguanine synthase in queuosine biosynthesis [Novosphingobium sp. PhB165]|uniref:Qat anti-phage system QueC-like protein QatC n=1 Tax=Novosphingobium sp. PhB165 TaxID=2485105 RepID=UPI00105346EF|nr:Qat anti-phage system QueC-like protein QatC [Novosphingobium sp. PhB165]TCM12857.1 7-cyano-7-deazaguanine synthase in queuosine biosynthesis [Novosphingobium sp. PhB165]
MVNLTVHATPDPAVAAAAHVGPDAIGVTLFGMGTPALPGLGAQLPRLMERGLLGRPSTAAWDFLAIALSAFAADRFVVRASSANSWTRVIGLKVALVDPAPWHPLALRISTVLRFLTGDIWHVSFTDGGCPVPNVAPKQHDRHVVSLFSGGLDSFLGALWLDTGRRKPFLVSQGSPKEIHPQVTLAQELGLTHHRFEGRVSERWRQPYEGSTRARSILFFGYGVVAATAANLRDLLVPENALIAINPPFTRRRMGSLSTRTTHPHLIAELNSIWADAGVDVTLQNPFFHLTKGEMLASAHHTNLSRLASASYSCGKGKRVNGQCGRCVPCLIRRASFVFAGVQDDTNYLNDLALASRNDDVLAARQAVAQFNRASRDDLARWIRKAGPLPADKQTRDATIDAVGRGLAELGELFKTIKWL